MGDDYEVDGTEYLARTVYETRRIGPIGFVHFKPVEAEVKKRKPTAKPVAPRVSKQKRRP